MDDGKCRSSAAFASKCQHGGHFKAMSNMSGPWLLCEHSFHEKSVVKVTALWDRF